MHFAISFVFAIQLASTFVHSAPTAPLDSATLLKNGQDAQKLNAQFKATTTSTSCNTGAMACIGNAIATCVNGAFDISAGKCSSTLSCFAIPNVKSAGTSLICTSEKSALSLINATGATGDVTGAGSSSSTISQTSKDTAPTATASGTDNDSDCSMTGTAAGPMLTAEPSADGDSDCTMTSESSTSTAPPSKTTAPFGSDNNVSAGAPLRVTVTVTVSATEITLPTTIQTISPSDASILLSSAAQAATPTPSMTNVPAVMTTPAPAAPSNATFSGAPSSVPPAFTILLTAPESTATNSPAASLAPAFTISLGAADSPATASTPGIAAAAVTSASAGSSSGGYGYGGY